MSPASAARISRADEPAGERRLKLGRLAGLLIALGAVLGAATELLAFARPADGRVVVPAVGALALALACGLVRWDALGPRALHGPPALGALGLAAAVALGGHDGVALTPLGFLGVVWCAYALGSRRAIALEVALLLGALLAAVVLTGPSSSVLAGAGLAAATAVAVAAVVTGLRERLEAGQRGVRELALRDPVTGVGNYRALHERGEYELVRHRRHGRELAVMVLDLDRFKEVNDTLGHPTGDRLLRDVAAALRATLREQDTVARQGGDEFALLVPESGADEARVLAGRVAHALARHEIAGLPGGARPVTTALGWAVFPRDGETIEDLLAVADARQLLHKQRRRRLPRFAAPRRLAVG